MEFEEHFEFPERCARCDSPDPDDEWQICKDLPHPVLHREQTFTVAVPVCRQCKTTLSRARVFGIILGVLLGLAAALITYCKLISQWSGWFSIAMAAFIALAACGLVYWLSQVSSGAYFARLGDDSNSLLFNNPVYQKEFDELNDIDLTDPDARTGK